MCGITGLIVRQNKQNVSDVLKKMMDAISHRGPDDEGSFITSSQGNHYAIGLGHRRLSIIDLNTGHQPIGNEDGSIQIVFNGEIYNYQVLRDELIARGHQFLTSSDTETIVHAYEEYGTACVNHFRGMFAFAIWDKNLNRLFLARDRFGKKPLFFYVKNDVLLFASEIKSLLEFPGITFDVDYHAVWDYFAYRYVPGPATLFAGIRKLLPGTYALWESGELHQHRYYSTPDQDAYSGDSLPTDPVGNFLALLDEAVRIRMISDVPFGAFLSGGIDSSAVVGLMARQSSHPVKTFSVGFAEANYSELDYAKTIAQQFKTDHHEIIITNKHLMDELPKLVHYRDAPVSEPADIPIYLLAKEARKSVKMVLTGEGSDEILGGYPKHVFERYAHTYQLIPSMLREKLLKPLVFNLPYRFHRSKIAIQNLNLDCWEERMPRWFGALSNKERNELVKLRPVVDSGNKGVQFDVSPKASALRRILYFDQTSWLPDNLLERGDRMTMASSIEARMPFMDHKLIAFVSSLPDRYRVRGMLTKWILRKATTHLLPQSILDRPKVGFRVPVDEWFRGPMRDYLYDHLAGSDSLTRIYYNGNVLDMLLQEHVQRRQNHEKLLWSLLNLEIWHRQYLGTGK